jgi:hypothetical protein
MQIFIFFCFVKLHHHGQQEAAAAEEERQEPIATMGNVVLVFVPRHTGAAAAARNQNDVVRIAPRTSLGACKHHEREFLQQFERRILGLIVEFRRQFPYKQTIRWSIEYGDDDDQQHTVHVHVKPSRSMSNR